MGNLVKGDQCYELFGGIALKKSRFFIKNTVTSSEADKNKAHRRHYGCNLNAKYQDLKLHALSKKYIKLLPRKAVTSTTSFIKLVISEAHDIEGCINIFFSCHCAITNCVDMLKNFFYNYMAIDDVKMHRTKIIKNVLCHHLKKELTDDIGSNKLCLLLDEDNDISIIKLLGASLIYFSYYYYYYYVYFRSL